MKDAPEIAPEIRGLLEEIVADPRSAIRLVPRRALRTWFDTGETVRASDVVRTSAERHLIEMHREELAALLCEAAWISYWKAPVMSYRPSGADGELYDPTEREPAWRERTKRAVATTPIASDGVELLRHCLTGVQPHRGWALGQASLALVPRDLARYYIALSVDWSRPSVAIALLNRFARRARPLSTKLEAVLSMAARACSLGMLKEARDIYREAGRIDPGSPCAWSCSFNISCLLGDEKAANWEGNELARIASNDGSMVVEVHTILRDWIRTRSASEREAAASTARQLGDQALEATAVICREYGA